MKSHCKYGHAYTADNTYVSPKGLRQCVICRNERNKKWMQEQRGGLRAAGFSTRGLPYEPGWRKHFGLPAKSAGR